MSRSKNLQKNGVDAFRLGDYEKALEDFEAAYQAAKPENNPTREAEILNDIGVARKSLGDLEGANKALLEALETFQALDNLQGEAQTLGNLGMVEEAAGQYEDAIQSYIDSASIFEELGDQDMALYSWQALSRLKLRRKEWIGAIAAYEEGISHLPDNSWKKKFLQKLFKMPNRLIGS